MNAIEQKLGKAEKEANLSNLIFYNIRMKKNKFKLKKLIKGDFKEKKIKFHNNKSISKYCKSLSYRWGFELVVV